MKYLSLVFIDMLTFWQNCFVKIPKFVSEISNYLRMQTNQKNSYFIWSYSHNLYILLCAYCYCKQQFRKQSKNIYIHKIFLYQIIFITLNKSNPQMLCYMKKCPTIYIKTDTVRQLEQPLVLKAFCKIKKNVTTWLHYWPSFTLTKMLSSLKKKIDYIPRKKNPIIKESNRFYFSVAHTLCYIWHFHCLFKFQVFPSWLEYYCLVEKDSLLSWYWLFSLNGSLI